MKLERPLQILALLLLVLLPASAAVEAGRPAAAGHAGRVVAAGQEGDFMTAFREAMRINAKSEMSRLVKGRTLEAIEAIIRICEAISEEPTDQLETEIAALREAWRDTMKTDFVDLQYEYFSLLHPEIKNQRRQLRQRFNLVFRDLEKAIAAGDKTSLPEIGLQMLGFGDGFTEMGDHYAASQAYIHAGRCFDQELRGEDADLRRACEAFGKGAQARQKAALLDTIYQETKARFEALEYEGYGDPTKGPEARRKAKETTEAASAFAVPMTFEAFTDLEGVQRPHFLTDPVYQIWTTIFLGPTGSEGTIGPMQKASPLVRRDGDSKALIDSDADGQPDLELPLTGKVTPVTVTIGTGEEQRPWAFLATIGQAQDTYQGLRFNLGPGDESLSIYLAPAASMVGTIGETPIRVLDDNLDGVYGSPPLEWAHVGTLDGSFQRDLDSIVVGESKVAQPWTELLQVAGAWYRLEARNGGTQLLVTPTEVETGKLRLDFKGPKPDWIVVRGETAANEGRFYEVVQGGKTGIDLPVGRYALYCGEVSQGERNQMAKALILPGRNTPGWNVSAGETTVMELGSPFAIDFEVQQTDEMVKVVGPSLAVVGRGQETYQRLWNCALQPEVASREAGKKKGSDEGRMRSAESQEQVDQDFGNDYRTMWFPLDFEFEKKNPGDALEVQLVEKKNKLFGKLESPWKG